MVELIGIWCEWYLDELCVLMVRYVVQLVFELGVVDFCYWQGWGDGLVLGEVFVI